jgi:membrane fusion protein (multidrug efflux system)
VAIGVAVIVPLLTASCEEPPAPPPPPPPDVYVGEVIQRDVPTYLELVGQTQGQQDVDIRARVEGFLDSVNFKEGTLVRKGDPLYTIDRQPLQATLSEAQADLATEQARVATEQARLEKADNDVARYKPLVAKQAVSQQELDNALSAQDAARSQVEAAKAAVEAGKAAVEKAKLDLGYTQIFSPIDGLVGTTLIKPGNFVGRGEATLLTTISQIDPIIFRVGVAEADYLRIVKGSPARAAQAATAAGIELTLVDGTVYPHKGELGPVEREVNAATGTLGIQLLFPNPDNVLRPGQYGRARILLDTIAGALLVPQRAVQELQGLYSVAIIGADNKVAFRNVKVGQRVDTLWVIEDGIKPGERVVVEGLQRIRDGDTVTPKPAPPAGTGTTAAEGK